MRSKPLDQWPWSAPFLCVLAIAIVGLVTLCAKPSPGQEATPRHYVLSVTSEDVQTIGKGLEGLPYRDVASLIQKLRQQIVTQDKAK